MTYSMKNGLRNLALGATLVAALGCSPSEEKKLESKTYTGKVALFHQPRADVGYYTIVFNDLSCATDYGFTAGERGAKALLAQQAGLDVKITYDSMTKNNCKRIDSLEFADGTALAATPVSENKAPQRWR